MLIERFCDQYKMLKKFSGCILKCVVNHSDFQCHIHHIKRIHSHPACPVSLFEVMATRHLNTTVKNSNVIEPEKPSLENIIATGILPVDPPGKIDNKLMKYSLQKRNILPAGH